MIQANFTPFPVLETERLILRRPLLTDAKDIFMMRSDPQVMQYIPRPLATKIEDVEELIQMIDGFANQNERINWAMEWKETGTVIGMIGYVNLKPEHDRGEVGYSLCRAWHRRGIMREALLAVLDYGFNTMRLNTVEAIIDANNEASGGLLEDVGFRKEAHFLQDFFHNGSYRDSIHYGMLRSEWESHHAGRLASGDARLSEQRI